MEHEQSRYIGIALFGASIGFIVYYKQVLQNIRAYELKLQSVQKVKSYNVRTNHDLDKKFTIKRGITFYYFPRSPCSRRVWITLLLKKIVCNMVIVDLMKGEQRNEKYLEINPQGKVPAIVVYDHESCENIVLYESQAIVEWLEDQFPDTIKLYPAVLIRQREDQIDSSYEALQITASKLLHDLVLYTEVKMYQYFELTLAEFVWPLSRQNVDGVIWRFSYSRHSFYNEGPGSEKVNNNDPFYKFKVSKIFDGNYISINQAKLSVFQILRGLNMLESSLDISLSKGNEFLLGSALSQADVALYPRLNKMPQNGICSNRGERQLFPNVVNYFNKLRNLDGFNQFLNDDLKIWHSGVYPKFIPKWWSSYLPWSLITLFGNLKSGNLCFKRITQSSLDSNTLRNLKSEKYEIIPRTVNSNEVILLYHPSQIFSVSVVICLNILKFKFKTKIIDIIHLEQYTDEYLKFMPFSELPVLIFNEHVIYGPQVIVEFVIKLLTICSQCNNVCDYFDVSSSPDCKESTDENAHLFSDVPTDKAIIRKWFGWSHTAWYYQLQKLQNDFVIIPKLRSMYKGNINACKESLLVKSTSIYCLDTLEYFDKAVSLDEAESLIWETVNRIETIELSLNTDSRYQYLCSDAVTYADIFILAFVSFGELYINKFSRLQNVDEKLASFPKFDLKEKYPRIHVWKEQLFKISCIKNIIEEMIENNIVDWSFIKNE